MSQNDDTSDTYDPNDPFDDTNDDIPDSLDEKGLKKAAEADEEMKDGDDVFGHAAGASPARVDDDNEEVGIRTDTPFGPRELNLAEDVQIDEEDSK